jgi:hypothetical protein
LCLDDAHHRDVHRGGRRWNTISGHQERFFLVRDRASSSNAAAQGATSKRKVKTIPIGVTKPKPKGFAPTRKRILKARKR